MTPERFFRGLRVWWLVYRELIVNVNVNVKINTCRRRRIMPVIPITRMVVVVMIVMRLITAGQCKYHYTKQKDRTYYFLHKIDFVLFISKNLPIDKSSKNQGLSNFWLWKLGIVLPR